MKNQTLVFVNKSPNPDPVYAKEGDSGFDLRAWLDSPVILKPLERKIIHTGIYLDIPTGTEIQIRPRSGCAAKQGLGILNSPATIDSNYVGELMIIAVNLSLENITIENGDRIAQAVLAPVYTSEMATLSKVEEIDKITSRGANKFGSTGIK